MNLRSTERVKKRDMVFQKLSVNMIQHYDVMYDVVSMTDWETLEDFQRKYSYIANPEGFKKIVYIAMWTITEGRETTHQAPLHPHILTSAL
jgi:hypothetical protein